MSLNILTGPSGCGKTFAIYNKILKESCENPNQKYILIVPEQSSLQAQRQIVNMHKDHGTFNIDVLTFGRLCYRIFDELNINLAETIDDTGKNLIVRKVMDSVKNDLKVVKAGYKQGFISEMKSMISELKQYGIKPDELANIIDKTGESRLRDKLSDILLVYSQFEKYIDGKYTTVEDKPDKLYDVIDNSVLLNNSVIAFDGFTGFTPIQYKLIDKMLAKAREAYFTVTISEDAAINRILNKEELFFLSKETIAKLGELADRHQMEFKLIPVRDNPDSRFAEAPALSYLEKHIFRYDNARAYEGDSSSIKIYSLGNVKDEISLVTAKILDEVRNNNYRFKDIAVIDNDSELYSDEIRRTFTEAGIPFFLDNKRSLIGNPLVEYIRGLLEIVNSNFSYTGVFRFLKNALCDIDKDNVDKFENYILASGIRGRKNYNEKFIRANEEINLIREAFVNKAESFIQEIENSEKSAKNYVKALYNFLKTEDIYVKIKGLAKETEDAAKSDELVKSYTQVIELFDRIYELLGDEQISLKEFAEILDAGFEEVKVGLIPPSMDAVLVGDLERSRMDNPKVLFVLGMNEGLIPKTSGTHGILSEFERRTLSDMSVVLSPTPREKVFIQNFYLYLNLTKPSKRLYLLYHNVDGEGRETRPSRIIEMIKSMYKEYKVTKKSELNTADFLAGAGNSMHIIADSKNVEKPDAFYTALSKYLMANENSRAKIEHLTDALGKAFADNKLQKLAAEILYDEEMNSNISRVEKYASCAFSHFVMYGLELNERKVYELNPADFGTISHSVLQFIFEELKKRGRELTDISDEERTVLVSDMVDKAATDYGNSFFNDSATNLYMKKRIKDFMQITVEALQKQLAASDFKPEYFEKKFKYDFEGVKLSGKIDRVDICRDDENTHVKIIDYKSGSQEFKFERIYAGLDLQLMVYLKSMLNELEGKEDGKVLAAAAFYNMIKDPIVNVEKSEEDYKAKILKELKPDGIVGMESLNVLDKNIDGTSDVIPVVLKKDGEPKSGSKLYPEKQIRFLADYSMEKLKSMVDEIKSGNIDVNPYEESCEYCNYKDICGFNVMKKDKYRKPVKFDKDESIWELIDYEGEED